MTKNQIIEQLFTGKNFRDCISKMEPEHLREDLKMEVALIVCEWPDEKVIGLHERKELEFFVVRVILNQIQSNSSPFFKKYRRIVEAYNEQSGEKLFGAMERGEATHQLSVFRETVAAIKDSFSEAEEMEERAKHEEMEENILNEIGGLYWYNAEMINLYKKHGNYRAIEKETGIPFISCYKTIQKSFKELKLKVLATNESMQ